MKMGMKFQIDIIPVISLWNLAVPNVYGEVKSDR